MYFCVPYTLQALQKKIYELTTNFNLDEMFSYICHLYIYYLEIGFVIMMQLIFKCKSL